MTSRNGEGGDRYAEGFLDPRPTTAQGHLPPPETRRAAVRLRARAHAAHCRGRLYLKFQIGVFHRPLRITPSSHLSSSSPERHASRWRGSHTLAAAMASDTRGSVSARLSSR